MADEKSKNALEAFLQDLPEDDREWFEERIAIIQFSANPRLSEVDAARSAFKCFQKYKKTERIAA